MRCSTSGRFTPAAATLMRISPAPGAGTGRCSGTSISAPPGARIAIAVMWAGRRADVVGIGVGPRTGGAPAGAAAAVLSAPAGGGRGGRGVAVVGAGGGGDVVGMGVGPGTGGARSGAAASV